MSSQPISLPSTSSNNYSTDYPMASGSYTGSPNGTFNPASYTRHFLGSPISWRPGSLGFGGRMFPNGSPMDHMLSAVEYNKQSASYESDCGSIINALSMVDREDELCRNYQCCGLQLTDLHALIEHFEEVHIIVVDNPHAPGGQHAQISVPFNPLPIPTALTAQQQQAASAAAIASNHPQQSQPQVPAQQMQSQTHVQAPCVPQQVPYPVPFDPDDMELEMDMSNGLGYPVGQAASNQSSPSSGAPTPPDTPVSTPLSAYASPVAYPSPKVEVSQLSQLMVPTSPYTSQPPSPLSYTEGVHTFEPINLVRSQSEASPPICRPNLNLNLASFSRPASAASHHSTPEPFNAYARYTADYSAAMLETDSGIDVYNSKPGSVKMECVPPSLVFSNAGTPEDTPSTSRVPSPTQVKASPSSTSLPCPPVKPVLLIPTPASIMAASNPSSASGSPSTSTPPSPSSRSSTSLSRAHTASLLLSKPFKCPKPNCNKSYKQANGLKYHITHGSCNFAPPKDLEHVQALLERKRRDRAAQAAAAEGITPSDHDRSNGDLGDLAISESDLKEVEREAELRLRPFACGVGDCQRRYKNMNGLRYHYQHSGEHGVIGLSMLASGVHECLNNGTGANGSKDRDPSREGRISRPSSKPSSRSASRVGTPVSATSPLGPTSAQHLAAQAAVVATLQQAHAFPPQQTSSSSLAPAATAQVQAQAQLAYQQRFVDNQRAQLAQQQQQLQQMQQQMALGTPSAQQQQQLQQMQAQFAAMHSRLYPTQQVDTTMSG